MTVDTQAWHVEATPVSSSLLRICSADGSLIGYCLTREHADEIVVNRGIANYIAEKHGTLLHLMADEEQAAFAQQQDLARIAELEAALAFAQKAGADALSREGLAVNHRARAEADATRAWELVQELKGYIWIMASRLRAKGLSGLICGEGAATRADAALAARDLPILDHGGESHGTAQNVTGCRACRDYVNDVDILDDSSFHDPYDYMAHDE